MLSFFPLDVLDEIWDVIGSVSKGFLTYSDKTPQYVVSDLGPHCFVSKSSWLSAIYQRKDNNVIV